MKMTLTVSKDDGYQEVLTPIDVEVDGVVVGTIQVRYVHDPHDPNLPHYAAASFTRSKPDAPE